MKARIAAAGGIAAGFMLGWMVALVSALYASKGGIKPAPADSPPWLDDLEQEAKDYEWPVAQ